MRDTSVLLVLIFHLVQCVVVADVSSADEVTVMHSKEKEMKVMRPETKGHAAMRVGFGCSGTLAQGLSLCSIVNGYNMTKPPSTIDAAVAEFYAVATTGSGLIGTGLSPTVLSASGACKTAFSNYFCVNMFTPCVLGSTISPCLQRCIQYATACQGASALAASALCAQLSPAHNTPTNANCFCGGTGGANDLCGASCSTQTQCSLAAPQSRAGFFTSFSSFSGLTLLALICLCWMYICW